MAATSANLPPKAAHTSGLDPAHRAVTCPDHPPQLAAATTGRCPGSCRAGARRAYSACRSVPLIGRTQGSGHFGYPPRHRRSNGPAPVLRGPKRLASPTRDRGPRLSPSEEPHATGPCLLHDVFRLPARCQPKSQHILLLLAQCSTSWMTCTLVTAWSHRSTSGSLCRSFTRTFVAVGTPVARRPPHRSVRAALLHTAPTSDVWRRSARSGADAQSEHSETTCRPAAEIAPRSAGSAGCGAGAPDTSAR